MTNRIKRDAGINEARQVFPFPATLITGLVLAVYQVNSF